MTIHRPPEVTRVGSGRGLSTTYSSSLARIVSTAVHRMIVQCEAYGVLYASEWSPLSDATLQFLLDQVETASGGDRGVVGDLSVFRCGTGRREPRGFRPDETAGARSFRLRHALGHVLDEHRTGQQVVRGKQDWFGYEESVADLFALVDLIPRHLVDEWHAQGRTEAEVLWAAFCETKRYCPAWNKARIEDRLRLRLLFPTFAARAEAPITL